MKIERVNLTFNLIIRRPIKSFLNKLWASIFLRKIKKPKFKRGTNFGQLYKNNCSTKYIAYLRLFKSNFIMMICHNLMNSSLVHHIHKKWTFWNCLRHQSTLNLSVKELFVGSCFFCYRKEKKREQKKAFGGSTIPIFPDV